MTTKKQIKELLNNNQQNKKSVEEIKAFLTELQESNNLALKKDLQNCFSDEELEKLDQDNPTDCYQMLSELLEDGGYFDIGIIYYARAIDYLKEHDQSLQESLKIASEMGYMLDNLNSETLASLLANRLVRYKFYELQCDIEDFFIN